MPPGRIVQINLSQGGVPKTAVPEAEITETGLIGDKQRYLKVHGGTEKAVCLWSLDVIETLQQEGHSIEPGYAGENVTIAGLEWLEVIPGKQLQLGEAVWLEITSYATPCRANMRWFADRRFSRINQKHHPGSSRVYARVLQTGKSRVGDAVAIAPIS